MKLLSVISKWTPQPENLRHLATCIFWLGQSVKKGLLWLMHKNWMGTLRTRWQAASMNDYARSPYKAITIHFILPEINWELWKLYVKTHTHIYTPERAIIWPINLNVNHVTWHSWDYIWEMKLIHLEISNCGHDVRSGRQGNRRSGYRLPVEMEWETRLCEIKWTWAAGHWQTWAQITRMYWVRAHFTCSLPRSILSIRWSPLWRSSARSNSSWAILSCKRNGYICMIS